MKHPTIEWFRRLIGQERSAALKETADAFVAPIIPRDRFDEVGEDLIPVHEGEGVFAVIGMRNGREDIAELHFAKSEGWTEAEVKGFLGSHGLDSEDAPTWGFTTETMTVETEDATVEETEDFFVIEGAHLTKSGVQKEKLRPREVFESAWMLYEGIPTTHGHPFPVVESMEQVTGMVRNVTLEDAPDGEVFLVGDLYLAKEAGVDGLDVTEENVDGNRTAFEAAQEGEAVQLSQGYLYQATAEQGEHNGKAYGERLTEIVPNHEALLDPVTDEEAACSPEEGCGVNPLIEAAREMFDLHPDPDSDGGDSASSLQSEESEEVDTMACDGECNAEALRSSLEEERDAKATREAKLDGARERLARIVDVEEDEPSLETLLARVEQQSSDAEDAMNELENAKADLAKECANLEDDLDRLDEDVEVEDRIDELEARSLPALREHCEMLQEKVLVEDIRTRTDRRLVGGSSAEEEDSGGMGFLTESDN